MKNWYLIDIKNGDYFEDVLDVTSQQEAITEGIRTWNSLSAHDQKLREGFWIAKYDLDEEGCIDYDSEEFYVDIRPIAR